MYETLAHQIQNDTDLKIIIILRKDRTLKTTMTVQTVVYPSHPYKVTLIFMMQSYTNSLIFLGHLSKALL